MSASFSPLRQWTLLARARQAQEAAELALLREALAPHGVVILEAESKADGQWVLTIAPAETATRPMPSDDIAAPVAPARTTPHAPATEPTPAASAFSTTAEPTDAPPSILRLPTAPPPAVLDLPLPPAWGTPGSTPAVPPRVDAPVHTPVPPSAPTSLTPPSAPAAPIVPPPVVVAPAVTPVLAPLPPLAPLVLPPATSEPASEPSISEPAPSASPTPLPAPAGVPALPPLSSIVLEDAPESAAPMPPGPDDDALLFVPGESPLEPLAITESVVPPAPTGPIDLSQLMTAQSSPLRVPPKGKPRRNPFVETASDPTARAQRLARTLVSDMISYRPDAFSAALQEGPTKLLEVFQDDITMARERYEDEVDAAQVSNRDALFVEALNEILGNGQVLLSA